MTAVLKIQQRKTKDSQTFRTKFNQLTWIAFVKCLLKQMITTEVSIEIRLS